MRFLRRLWAYLHIWWLTIRILRLERSSQLQAPIPIQPLRTLSEQIIGMPDTCQVERFTESTTEEGRQEGSWAVIHTTKCRYRTANARELELAGRLSVNVTGVITIPFNHGTPDGLQESDRLIWEGETFEISGILERTAELSPHLEVLVAGG